jgi:protein-S-isoprenylcysteine O-methyltransferase Ste14
VTDIPLLVVGLTVAAYWLRVGAMVVRARRRERRDVGVVPERPDERLMLWLGYVPVVLGWCALPWLAPNHDDGWLALPAFARDGGVYPALRWIAAGVVVACFVLTLRCWHTMGRNWRMDISERNTTLVTSGLFARIRHPIYAFSIAMMLGTLVVLPTAAMLVVAVVHVTLMNVKARNEEAHLMRMHGDAYVRYVARTGRFIPRAAVRDS